MLFRGKPCAYDHQHQCGSKESSWNLAENQKRQKNSYKTDNYSVPDPVPQVDTMIEYWYGEEEKRAGEVKGFLD